MMRRGPGRAGMMAARMARMTAVRMQRRRRRRRRRRVLLVGGLVAVGVYKFSKRDVERIEEHTGQSAEELTDEQLAQAAKELGIETEELSDEDWDYVEEQDAQEGGEAGGEADYIAQLERLGDLHKQGILTDEEFEAQKKKVLGS